MCRWKETKEKHKKEDVASPTAAIESVMLTCVIDAMEERDVAITDIPGAYLTAQMDEKVHVKLEGKLAELMVLTAPETYRTSISLESGKKVLYVKLKKALYGCLKSALLFYQKLSGDLVEEGFEINPYDPCVANKTINGKQLTIVWHVDDLKISHVDPQVVTNTLTWLESKYGELRTTRGKKHNYLGMDMDFSKTGEVSISMIKYLQETIEKFPENIEGSVSSPAAAHLFEINDQATKLEDERAQLFHTIVAKLLWICKRSRPDIHTAIAFLSRRTKEPDEDDWKKLRRLLIYLHSTLDMPLTLQANNLHTIQWWVDGAFAVHNDMKSHTGITMSLGKGSIYSSSTTQKINTRSSTEAELVGVNDGMSQIMWTRYFLEEQGFEIKNNIIYQDNTSAILLEENGKKSSGKKTRHINIRYFYIQDRVEHNEIQVKFCPTDEMVGDFFTKPLQGAKFRKFRAIIMNINQDITNNTPSPHRSVLDDDVIRDIKTEKNEIKPSKLERT
jgi:hypothetical protein